MLTKQDYNTIALNISQGDWCKLDVNKRIEVVKLLMPFLKSSNPKFSGDKFLEACRIPRDMYVDSL